MKTTRKTKPLCQGCYKKPVKWNSHFCTFKCGWKFAEMTTDGDRWCPDCKEWIEDGMDCEHNEEGGE